MTWTAVRLITLRSILPASTFLGICQTRTRASAYGKHWPGPVPGEPHPPGYSPVMLAWTKWFGSSIFSLRLPSLLFGVASILLIYVLATLTDDTLTGLLAAAMLAANSAAAFTGLKRRVCIQWPVFSDCCRPCSWF